MVVSFEYTLDRSFAVDLVSELHSDIYIEKREVKKKHFSGNLLDCRDKLFELVHIWALNKRKVEQTVVDSSR